MHNNQPPNNQNIENMFFVCPFCHNKTAYVDYKKKYYRLRDTMLYSLIGLFRDIDSGTVYPYSFDVSYFRCLSCGATWKS